MSEEAAVGSGGLFRAFLGNHCVNPSSTIDSMENSEKMSHSASAVLNSL
jgi:hypothetical protein